MKVLVVEDDTTVGQYVKRGLEEARYHADLVTDGEEGLRLATSGHYDLVVLDLRLPKMNGQAVLRMLRDRGSEVPVLVLGLAGWIALRRRGGRSGSTGGAA